VATDNLGTISFDFDAAVDQLLAHVDQALKSFDRLIDKMAAVARSSSLLSSVSGGIGKALGVAGAAGAAVVAYLNYDKLRGIIDKVFISAGKLPNVFKAVATGSGGLSAAVRVGVQALHKLVEAIELGEVGIFAMSGRIREYVTKLGLFSAATAAAGVATAALPGPVGAFGASLLSVSGIVSGLIAVLGALTEAIGARLVHAAEVQLEKNSRLAEQYVEMERSLFGLKVAVQGYNEATGETQNAQRFIDLTNEIASTTGLARRQVSQAILTLLDFSRVTRLNAQQIAELVKASADYATATDQDFFTVVRGIDNVFRGYSQTLQIVGIQLDSTELAQLEYVKSLGKQVDELTKVEKAHAVYLALLEKFAFTTGQSAKALNDTYFGALIRVQVAQQNINIALGEGVAAAQKFSVQLEASAYSLLASFPTLLKYVGFLSELKATIQLVTGGILENVGTVVKWIFIYKAGRIVFGELGAAGGILGSIVTKLGAQFAFLLTPLTFITSRLTLARFGMIGLVAAIGLSLPALARGVAHMLGWGSAADDSAQAAENLGHRQETLGDEFQKATDHIRDQVVDLAKTSIALTEGEEAATRFASAYKLDELFKNAGTDDQRKEIEQLQRALDLVSLSLKDKVVTSLDETRKKFEDQRLVLQKTSVGAKLFNLDLAIMKTSQALVAAESARLTRAVEAMRNQLHALKTIGLAGIFRGFRDEIRRTVEDTKTFVSDMKDTNAELTAEVLEAVGGAENALRAQQIRIRQESNKARQQEGTDTARKLVELNTRLKEIDVARAYLQQQYVESLQQSLPITRRELVNRVQSQRDSLAVERAAVVEQIRAAKSIHDQNDALREQVENRKLSAAQAKTLSDYDSEALTTLKQRTDLARAGLDRQEQDLEAQKSRLDNEQAIHDIDVKINALRVQKLGLDQQDIQNELRYLAVQKREAAAASDQGRVEELDRVIQARQNESAIIGQQISGQRALNKAQADSIDAQTRALDRAQQLKDADLDTQRAINNSQIETLQLSLEEEHSITRRQDIQRQIIALKRRDIELDLQGIQNTIDRLNAEVAIAKAKGHGTDELEFQLQLETKHLDAARARIPALEKELELVREIGLEQAEIGRDLENAFAEFGAETLFDPKNFTDNFDKLGDAFVDTWKNAFKVTFANKLGFEDIVSKNLFEDAGGLVKMFGQAFGLIGDSGKQAFNQELPAAAASGAEKALQAANDTRGGWFDFFGFILDIGKNTFNSLLSIISGVLGVIGKVLGIGGGGTTGGGILGFVGGLLGIGGGGTAAAQTVGTGTGSLVASGLGLGFNLGSSTGLLGRIPGVQALSGFLSGPNGLLGGLSSIVGGVVKAVRFLGNIVGAVGGFAGLTKGSPLDRAFSGTQGVVSAANLGRNFLGSAQAGSAIIIGNHLITASGQIVEIAGPSATFAATTAQTGEAAAGLLANQPTSLLGQLGNILPTISAILAVAGAAYGIAEGARGIARQNKAQNQLFRGDPAAGRNTALASVGLAGGIGAGAAAGVAVGATFGTVALPGIGTVAGALIGAIVGAAVGAAVSTAVNAAVSGATNKAVAETLKTGLKQEDLKKKVREKLTTSWYGILFTVLNPIGALIGELAGSTGGGLPISPQLPNIETIFDKIFGETVQRYVGPKVTINRQLTKYLGQGVVGTARRDSLQAFRQGGALRGDTFLTAQLVSGLIGAGTENEDRLRRFFLILANSLASGKKTIEEVQKELFKIVRGVTSALIPAMRAVNGLFQDGQKHAERTAKQVDLVARAYQKFLPGIDLAALAKQFATPQGGVQIRPFQRALRGDILEQVQAGNLELTKRLDNKIGDPFLGLTRRFNKKFGEFVDVIQLAIDVMASGVKHAVDRFQFALKLKVDLLLKGLPDIDNERLIEIADRTGQFHGRRRRRERGVATIAIEAEASFLNLFDAMKKKFEGRELVFAIEQSQREQKGGLAALTLELDKLPKLHGKKFKEAMQRIPEIIQKVTDATKQWADNVLQLRQQIIDLQHEQFQTNLDLSILIGNLSNTPVAIEKIFQPLLDASQQAVALAQNPADRLDALKNQIGVIQQFYSALIQEVQHAAEIQKKPIQDRLDAIDKENTLLQRQHNELAALAQLHKTVEANLRDLRLSQLTGPQRVASIREEIARERGRFRSLTGNDKAESGQKLADLYNQLLSAGQGPQFAEKFRDTISAIERLRSLPGITVGARQDIENKLFADLDRARTERGDPIFKEVVAGLKEIEKATKGAAAQDEAILKRLETLDTNRNLLLDQLRIIDDDTRKKIEAIQLEEARTLGPLLLAVNQAYTNRINGLQSDLVSLLGPGSDLNRFLTEPGYAQKLLMDKTNEILNQMLKKLGGTPIALASGGLALAPLRALVAERGKELIAPLDDPRTVNLFAPTIQKALASLGVGRGGQAISNSETNTFNPHIEVNVTTKSDIKAAEIVDLTMARLKRSFQLGEHRESFRRARVVNR